VTWKGAQREEGRRRRAVAATGRRQGLYIGTDPRLVHLELDERPRSRRHRHHAAAADHLRGAAAADLRHADAASAGAVSTLDEGLQPLSPPPSPPAPPPAHPAPLAPLAPLASVRNQQEIVVHNPAAEELRVAIMQTGLLDEFIWESTMAGRSLRIMFNRL